MKFKGKGKSISAQVRADKAKYLRELDQRAKNERRQALKASRAALREQKKTASRMCRNRKRIARSSAAEAKRQLRQQIQQIPVELRQTMAALDAQCGVHVAEVTAPIQQQIEGLRTEIGMATVEARHGRERERRRPKLSASERRAQTIDEARRDVEAHDPRLLRAFDRLARTLPVPERKTLSEAFLELAAETPELLEEQQRASAVRDLDMACAEAIHVGELGNDEARTWAANNCKPEGKARKKRSGGKGSAASRTVGMYGSDIVPPEATDTPETPKAPKEPAQKSKKKPRGQQSLSGGPLGGSLLDVPF